MAQDIVLRLRNGDRLSGRLLSESTNAVVLATSFSDQVSIAKSLIEHREDVPTATNPPSSSTNATGSASPAPPAPLVPATGIASELPSTNKPAASATAAAPSAKPPKPSGFHKFLKEWRGEAQLGANLGFSTKDREAFTGHIRLTENHAFANKDNDLRNIIDYDVAYGTTEGVLSDNRMEGSFKTEVDLTKRFLVYGKVTAGYDEIRTIDFEYDLGPGVGYKWVTLSNFVFKTELGGDYQEQFFPGRQQNNRFSLRLDEDSWWQLTPKIRWDQKVEFFPEVDDLEMYRLRAETNLSYLLRENLTLSFNVVDQYDTGLPAGVSRNDLQIRSLLGIKF